MRLRVTKSELDRAAQEGFVEDEIRFSAESRLVYRLEMTGNQPLSARFEDARIVVSMPKATARRWFDDGEVSVQGHQALAEGRMLEILIEKDFACLVPRKGEDSGDFFPNPQANDASQAPGS